MTKNNQRIRDSLKEAESIIVTALAHQPEDNGKCWEHLVKTCAAVHKITKRVLKEEAQTEE